MRHYNTLFTQTLSLLLVLVCAAPTRSTAFRLAENGWWSSSLLSFDSLHGSIRNVRISLVAPKLARAR